MNPQQILSSASAATEKLVSQIQSISDYVPSNIDFGGTLTLVLIIGVISVAAGFLFRMLFGPRSSLSQSLSNAIGILFVYVMSVILFIWNPMNIEDYVNSLPFVIFRKDILILVPFRGTPLPLLCNHLLSLVILAFLVNLADALIPDGNNVFVWFFLRVITVGFAIMLNTIGRLALEQFLPEALNEYAPPILLAVLIAFLLLGVFKWITDLVVIAVNPIFGSIYAFFFSSFIGKQLTKAVLTTAIISSVFYYLDYLYLVVITLSQQTLLSLLPFALGLVCLWYFLKKKL